MSVLKRKSSIVLIVLIVAMLLLIPIWYTMLAPMMVESELEKIDMTTSYEGTLFYLDYGSGELPIRIEGHIYTEEVKGNNVVLRVDVKMKNMTNPDEPGTLDDFTYNSTYVFNKKTLENVPDAPEADKNRTGYDPLFPTHLKLDEDIPNAWLDNLNITGTLEFKESIVEEGITLYKYHVNETIMKYVPEWDRNITLTSARTIWVEPLSGLLAYTENETLSVYLIFPPEWEMEPWPLVRLKYTSTPEAKTQGIADAKTMYSGMQLLDLYIPAIFGVVAIILVVVLAFNVRRLRKKSLKPKT